MQCKVMFIWTVPTLPSKDKTEEAVAAAVLVVAADSE